MQDFIQAQEFAAQKLSAVTDYLEKRLGDRVYWECSSDLDEAIYLYLPDGSRDGEMEDLTIRLSEIGIDAGNLDAASEARLDSIMTRRLL